MKPILENYKKYTEIYEIKNKYGYLLWRYGTDDNLEIIDMEVEAEHRRKGYGKDLIDNLSKLANGKIIFLFTKVRNITAQKFYEKIGFKYGGQMGDNILYYRL